MTEPKKQSKKPASRRGILRGYWLQADAVETCEMLMDRAINKTIESDMPEPLKSKTIAVQRILAKGIINSALSKNSEKSLRNKFYDCVEKMNMEALEALNARYPGFAESESKLKGGCIKKVKVEE